MVRQREMKNKGNIQGRFKAKESNTHLSKITLITVALGKHV